MTPAGNEIGVAMGQRRDQVKRSTLVPPLSVVDPLGRRLARTAVPASVIGGDQIGKTDRDIRLVGPAVEAPHQRCRMLPKPDHSSAGLTAP